MVTPLGSSTASQGEEVTLERMDKKPAMMEALSARSAEEAPLKDKGEIPGDHLGKKKKQQLKRLH